MVSRAALRWRTTPVFLFVAVLLVHLHELGHATAAIVLGLRPVVLYPGAVANRVARGHVSERLIVAATGPITSLVLAAVGWIAYRIVAERARPETRLVLVWTTFFGFMGSIGYLLLTPFGGDTQIVAESLGLPPIVRWAAFGAGVVAMRLVSRPLLPALGDLAPSSEDVATPAARFSFIRDVAVVPWMLLVVLTALGDFPPKQPWGIVAVAGWGVPLVSGMFDARKADGLVARGDRWSVDVVPWVAAVGVAVLLAIDVVLLRPGLMLVR